MVCDKYNLVRPVVEQPQYNLFARDNMEVKYRRLFQQGKLGTTVWSPLASGILTGKYNDGIPEGSRFDKNQDLIGIFNRYFTGEKKEKTLSSLNKFSDLAKELGCSMAQLAMAWVVANPDVSTALTGASRVEQLKDIIKSLEVVPKLTADVQRRIEEIFQSQPTSKNDHKTFAPFPNRRRDVLQY